MKPLFINISDQENFPGIKIYETKLLVSASAIILPGVGIFIHSGITGSQRLRVLQHEYGHYLDYLSFSGFAMIKFYIFIGLPSLLNAATGIGGNHKTYRTELRANRLAEKWFGNKLSKDYTKIYPVK